LSFVAEDSLKQRHPEYPAPPSMPWGLLLTAFVVIDIVFHFSLPKPIAPIFFNLVFHAWGVYLRFWIRDLEPKATSIYWTLATFCCDAICLFLFFIEVQTPLVGFGILLYWFFSFALGITSIYVVRHELQKHYTEVEPFGLRLGGVMTFFFSYVYFQWHLGFIGEKKRKVDDDHRARPAKLQS
jgi:hypothetical protein